MLLQTREPWLEQPPQFDAVLDPDHPLVEGLVFDLAPPSSLNFFNTVDGRKAIRAPGAALAPQKYGCGHAVAQANDNGIDFGGYPIVTAFPFSILIVADTLAEANRKWLLSMRQSTGGLEAINIGVNAVATAGASSDASGSLYLYTIGGGSQTSPTTGASGAVQNGVHLYGITCDGSTARYYVDGVFHSAVAQALGTACFASAQEVRVEGFAAVNNNARQFDRSQIVTRVWNNRLLSEADFKAQFEQLWGIYLPKTRLFWTGTAGAAVLAGNAAMASGAIGALSTAIPLTGAAIAVATASGAISTAMALSGAAAAVTVASGTMTVGVALSGSALSVASATGAMQIQVALSGAAVASAAATGALALTGTALAGNAVATASAAGSMSTSIPLAGAASVVASASGNFAAGAMPLAGAAVAVAVASGALTVTVSLSGSAVAQAVAAGGMAIQVPLSGSAILIAAAMGDLSGGAAGLVSDPGFTVRLAKRSFTARLPKRNFTVRHAR